jgi:hypothetical protein
MCIVSKIGMPKRAMPIVPNMRLIVQVECDGDGCMRTAQIPQICVRSHHVVVMRIQLFHVDHPMEAFWTRGANGTG